MIIYEEIYKKHGLSKTQAAILDIVGTGKVVCEIGPSTGYMARAFLKNNCIIDVVEINKIALAKLPKKIRKVINYSIENKKIENSLAKDYDFIIMADVLEHLINPAKALKILHGIATAKTKLLISLPNIASWPMRKQLFLDGDFEYQNSGLLDRTHLHFYTVSTLPKFLLENRWKVEKIIGTIIRLPFDRFINKVPIIYEKLAEKYQNLAYYHFLTIAHK